MRNTELTKLALKIFAIYAFIQAILAIPQFFQAYVLLSNGSEYSSDKWFLLIGISAVVLLLIFSVLIWRLSNNAIKTVSTNSDNSPANVSECFVLSVLGVYLIVYGLTRVVFTATGAYYASHSINNVNFEITQNIIYVVVYLAVTLIGLSLVVKASGWAALLNRLRHAGT